MKNTTMADKARRFQQMHDDGDCFVLANAWSAGSAMILEQAGIAAIGTTSAGIAYQRGLPDYEGALSLDAALTETRDIAAAVQLPVSMDAENGYGDDSKTVFDNMRRIAASGVVGASIEDYSRDPQRPLYDIEFAAERIRAAREAVAGLGYPFVLTARAECFLVGHEDPFAESVRRLNRYREAGADCLYAPGLKDLDSIRALVDATDGPINVVVGIAGARFSVGELGDAGVRRISIGGSLARACLGLVRSAAREILDQGSFEFTDRQIPDGELCRLFADARRDEQSP